MSLLNLFSSNISN